MRTPRQWWLHRKRKQRYKQQNLIRHVTVFSEQYFESINLKKEMLGVRNINAVRTKKGFQVTFHLSRPGIFIGKQGKTIEGLEKYLSDKLLRFYAGKPGWSRDVHIHIVETEPLWFGASYFDDLLSEYENEYAEDLPLFENSLPPSQTIS